MDTLITTVQNAARDILGENSKLGEADVHNLAMLISDAVDHKFKQIRPEDKYDAKPLVNVAGLINMVRDVPMGAVLNFQTVGLVEGAWYMTGSGKVMDGDESVVISQSHHQLHHLPEIPGAQAEPVPMPEASVES